MEDLDGVYRYGGRHFCIKVMEYKIYGENNRTKTKEKWLFLSGTSTLRFFWASLDFKDLSIWFCLPHQEDFSAGGSSGGVFCALFHI